MKRIPGLLIALGALLVAGCASQTEVAGTDLKRASELNAELGLAYLQQGRMEIANAKLEKALEQDPSNGNANHYMAELKRRVGADDEAVRYYRKAMELLPQDSALKNNFGVFLCSQGQYDEGFKYLFQVLEDPIYDAKDQVNENLGLCAQQRGNTHMAEQFLQTALKANPKLPNSLLAMAQISYDKRDFKPAYAYYKRFLTLSQQNAESLWVGILLEHQRGNRDAVQTYATLLKGKFPDSREAQLLRKMQKQGRI
ncbi:MAG: type IV pilus biogenesis/stability protein PilW [Pseudomonadota bacterium]|nr:MAG: type IV pilus biogenesis/stability protein PilW [Pseudomonadota bacterium]